MQLRTVTFIAAGALALAGCTTTSPHYAPHPHRGSASSSSSAPASRSCANCGIVTHIQVISSNRSAPSNTGTVLGGIVGAVAGRQISKETGGSTGNKNVATVAGAAGGALAGNAIQNHVTADTYKITVRMDDGRSLDVNQHELAGVSENTYVRVINGRVVLR